MRSIFTAHTLNNMSQNAVQLLGPYLDPLYCQIPDWQKSRKKCFHKVYPEAALAPAKETDDFLNEAMHEAALQHDDNSSQTTEGEYIYTCIYTYRCSSSHMIFRCLWGIPVSATVPNTALLKLSSLDTFNRDISLWFYFCSLCS